MISAIESWKNGKKAANKAELTKIQEQIEKKNAEHIEQTRNKIAMIHKQVEEKKAIIQVQKGEDLLKAEEKAAKYRATRIAPKKLFGCL